jgi:hypothetical protein
MILDSIPPSVLTLGPHDANNLVLLKYSNQRKVTVALIDSPVFVETLDPTYFVIVIPPFWAAVGVAIVGISSGRFRLRPRSVATSV